VVESVLITFSAGLFKLPSHPVHDLAAVGPASVIVWAGDHTLVQSLPALALSPDALRTALVSHLSAVAVPEHVLGVTLGPEGVTLAVREDMR
jgi:hypothetical protein